MNQGTMKKTMAPGVPPAAWQGPLGKTNRFTQPPHTQKYGHSPAVQPAAQLWVDTVADVRVHGATNRRPVDMFEEERAHLKPLNPVGFDLARVRTVSCRRQQAISERSARRIERIGAEPAALQLTRSADLLELEIPEPDLSIYDRV
jgi:hypothetical protein